MFPMVASMYPSGWIMGMGHQAVPKERICSPALIYWGFRLWKVHLSIKRAGYLLHIFSVLFVSVGGEEGSVLDTKHFLSGTCKSDPTHLPKRHTPRPVRLPKTETLFGQQLLRDEIPTLTMATEGFYVGQQILPQKHSSPSMGKEWVPPGENVGNVSICSFWLARRCSCLHNKITLATSARLLEKNWHRLER